MAQIGLHRTLMMVIHDLVEAEHAGDGGAGGTPAVAIDDAEFTATNWLVDVGATQHRRRSRKVPVWL